MRFKKNRLVVILSCIYILLFVQCGTEKSVIGTYIVNNRAEKDSLFIHENHTFTQHYSEVNGNSFINEGTWSLSADKIEFVDFVWYLKGYGPKDKQKVFWNATYHTGLSGQTSISIDDDLEIKYLMIK